MKKFVTACFIVLVAGSLFGASVGGSLIVVQGSGVSTNDVLSIASNATVSVASLAAALGIPNGNTTLTVDDSGCMTFTVVTNSTSVYVVSTNGTGYNGPAAGTVFTSSGWDANYPGGGGAWLFQYDVDWFLYYTGGDESSMDSARFAALYYGVDPYTPTKSWTADGLHDLNTPGLEAVGTLVISRVPLTNYITFYPMDGGLTTNFTVAVGDTMSFTNGLLSGRVAAP